MTSSPNADTRFRRIFDAHLEVVQRYCVRRLSTADANDAVSEVFLTVWRRIGDVPAGDEALPWLIGVARNVVRNVQRSSRRQYRLAAKAQSVAADHAWGADVPVVRASQYDEVAKALDTLSDEDREVIRLRAWEELTAQQIGVVLGCSEAAAAKRVARATARLSQAVERRRGGAA